MLNIPNKESIVRGIDPADLEDLQAEAEANRAEARDGLEYDHNHYLDPENKWHSCQPINVGEGWDYRLPEKFQG